MYSRVLSGLAPRGLVHINMYVRGILYEKARPCTLLLIIIIQGGRTWQPFVRGKNGPENFRQARIYNFCDKCVVFARNREFANLTQKNMQYIPSNSALLAQETLLLTQKGTFLPKDLQKKVRKS